MPDTCRRCSEPAAVQLPRGGRLCSGCAADRITHLYAEWDVSVSQCDEVSRERDEARDRVAHLDVEWDVLAEQLEAAESERDAARVEVEQLRVQVEALGRVATLCRDCGNGFVRRGWAGRCFPCWNRTDPEPGE